MKRNIVNIILIVILILGLSLLLYPTVSDYVNSRTQSRVVRDYSAMSADMSKQQSDNMIAAAKAYNEELRKTKNAFYHPEYVEGYDEVLDVTGTGIMGYISIEKINVELPIYHTVDEGVLQIAVGHLPGSSFPIGGPGTHAVLSGHRGLPSALLFSHLDELEIGDTFQISVLKEQFTYEVDQIKIVLPHEVEDLQIEDGKEYCTLMTCTPYGINSHRLLIRGHITQSVKEGDPLYIVSEAYQIDPIIVMPALAGPMFVIWLIWLGIRYWRRKNKEKHKWKGLNNVETE